MTAHMRPVSLVRPSLCNIAGKYYLNPTAINNICINVSALTYICFKYFILRPTSMELPDHLK